ncbi:MAG: phosphoenolpyruvate synthase [Ignavibacteria bacterium]|nr:phosphoenolpyruvate synthase [Ignavibacteria bacterium]
MKYCKPLRHVRLSDVPSVGGKNASVGEMLHYLTHMGINIPDGFALTTDAFWQFLIVNNIRKSLEQELSRLDVRELSNLADVGMRCRSLVAHGAVQPEYGSTQQESLRLPNEIWNEARLMYDEMFIDPVASVAVRSSASAEDLPDASFAGQHDSFLNVRGHKDLHDAIIMCYISLFNDRAIKYRIDNGIEHMNVGMSVGVQRMVRADVGSAGVAFTIDPETGFSNVVYITSCWGLGESIVQGAVNPDEFYVYKTKAYQDRQTQALNERHEKEQGGFFPVIRKRVGSKENMSVGMRDVFSITDSDVQTLTDWCLKIESHYMMPMDVEFAKDGITQELFVVQARPETVQSRQRHLSFKEYKLKTKPEPICKGKAVGHSIASGTVRIVRSLADAPKVKKGDVIVADITNPDWNALLTKAICIVTNKGGRTSHASIVARELGIHAVVGTGNATERLSDGQLITVSCIEGDEGFVYDGLVKWDETDINFRNVPETIVKPMLILADPDKAFHLSFYPSAGVGLLRMEFIISNSIAIHPMALARFDDVPDGAEKVSIEALTRHYAEKKEFFVDQLSQSLATVAAAFHPRPVIVRMSDFKTNEYALLIGGKYFEPTEENPMLGFRGASRYYNERYREGFALECAAVRRVRNEWGFDNVKAMIPFCRTVDEGRQVLETMKQFGLVRGEQGLEVYVMVEIPSNVILAKEFAEIFDGFSIGSNDLTQLTLGIDRDSSIISNLFDESNNAVKSLLASAIKQAKEAGKPIGLCGQAPSDHPEFAQFLVEQGIGSISFTADALLKGIQNISQAESKSWKKSLKEKLPSSLVGVLGSESLQPLLLLSAEHE